MWRVACGVWRVACGVWRVACGVWRVACGVHCPHHYSRAQADKDQQPRLKNMEKFYCIAGEPGLVALVLAVLGDDNGDDLAPAETADQGLFALLNTTNSMASSLLSTVYAPTLRS